MRTPEDWARCLRLAARLPGESFANILLISAQRPGATLLRGYDAWRAMGRQVSRQEKGIAIFAAARRPRAGRRDPHTGQEANEPVPTWRDAERVGYVWDLSQTSGHAIIVRAAIPSPPGQTPPGLWDALCWMARREGFAVEREHGCPDDGVTMWTARRIRVLPGLDGQQAAWALAHQLGHVLLHEPVGYPPGTTTSGCAGVHKAEADSVAFVLCTRYDITTAPWERRLRDIDGPLLAMRDAATLIAGMLPPDTAGQIRQVTGDREISMTDDLLRPVDNPELTEIARLLPADTPYQIMRIADKLGFDASEVLAEVANAVTRNARSPKGQSRGLGDDADHSRPARSPARLAASSFPPLASPPGARQTPPPGVPLRGYIKVAPTSGQVPPRV